MEEHPVKTDPLELRVHIRWTPAVWCATGFGIGLVVPAPGTIAGLWGIPLAVAISWIPGEWLQILVIAMLCLAGIPVCGRAARDLGGTKDPGAIALDEIASMPIVFLFFSPITVDSWEILAIGFLLHRFFDIIKPPPARQLERLPGGLGIMADDWMASCYALATLHAAVSAWLWWHGPAG
ncbi:MAG: phosphatidylglycerophosphatase A [Pirellulales bacterium]|nr:phosphatidylglycerophosphatase A [Pirellulales bacterium]